MPRLRLLFASVLTLMIVSGFILGGTAQEATPAAVATPLASPAGSPMATPHARDATSADHTIAVTREVTIELTDEGFNPPGVQATTGDDLEITLISTGTRIHAFQIEELGIDVTLEPGERQVVTVTTQPFGTFYYMSDAPGDENMRGELIFYI